MTRTRTEIIAVDHEGSRVSAELVGLESLTPEVLAELTPVAIAKLFSAPPENLSPRPGESPDDALAKTFRRRKAALGELPPELRLKAVAAIYELKAKKYPATPAAAPRAITPRTGALIPAEAAVSRCLAPETLTALTIRRNPLALKIAIVDVPDGKPRRQVFAGVLAACLTERESRLHQLELQAQSGAVDAAALERGKQQAEKVLAQGARTLAGIDGRDLRHFRSTLRELRRKNPNQAALVIKNLNPMTVLALGEPALELATAEQLAAAARSNWPEALPQILAAVTTIDSDACTPGQPGFGLLEEVTERLAAGPNAEGIAKRISNLVKRGDDTAIEAAGFLGIRLDQD